MITFTIIVLTLLALIICGLVAIGAIGLGVLLTFGDVAIAILIIVGICKLIFKRK